jgi:hypothetical protein
MMRPNGDPNSPPNAYICARHAIQHLTGFSSDNAKDAVIGAALQLRSRHRQVAHLPQLGKRSRTWLGDLHAHVHAETPVAAMLSAQPAPCVYPLSSRSTRNSRPFAPPRIVFITCSVS